MKFSNPIKAPSLLLPNRTVDLTSFAVIACDQFTSQKSYWDDLKHLIGPYPSALHMIFPEAYLNLVNEAEYIKNINSTIRQYLKEDVLVDIGECFVLVERETPYTKRRLGLVIAIDLEAYSFLAGSKSLIRATEATVVERIPPRLKIRKNAQIELSHVQFLFNDKNKTIIEKLYESRQKLPVLYDFPLNQGGGHLKGYQVLDTEPIIKAFENLLQIEEDNLMFVVGDGNHSLATAKTHWDNIKTKLSTEERINHPARFSIVEAINLYDEGLTFEPIHRVVFNVGEDFINGLKMAVQGSFETHLYTATNKIPFTIPNNTPMAYRLIQDFIDKYLQYNPETSVDYVHDLSHTYEVVDKHKNSIAIIMPSLHKEDLFDYIAKGDVLPRKTFSMGYAVEKRYYLESKKIK